IERRLLAYDHAGDRVLAERAEPDELADYIGREPAAKLQEQIANHERAAQWEREQWGVDQDPETGRFLIYDPNGEVLHNELGMPMLYPRAEEAEANIDRLLKADRERAGWEGGNPSLEGLDLQVGGEGMKSFYDQLLPARLQRILRPFGATV